MTKLQLALEDRFRDDEVRVTIDGREVARFERLSTRVQIGLAEIVELDVPEGARELRVELPQKGVSTSIPLGDPPPGYIGVSLAKGDRSLDVRTGDAPVGYV